MARYWIGGMGVVAGVPKMPSQALDFALYSDGTILLGARSGDLGALPGFKVARLSPEIAKQRHADYLAAFRNMKKSYTDTCWILSPDGSKRGFNCTSDAYSAFISVKDPSSEDYLTVSVYDAASWKELPEILDFVPAKFFELMAWMDARQNMPSGPWPARNFVISLGQGDPNYASDAFRWPEAWPQMPAKGREICVPLDPFTPQEAARLPVTLGRSHIKAPGERLYARLFDVYVPGLNQIAYFQATGPTKICP